MIQSRLNLMTWVRAPSDICFSEGILNVYRAEDTRSVPSSARGVGNTMNTFLIREAASTDVTALAQLHVTTFNETHAPLLMNGPTYEVRESQWRQAFQSANGSWFCFVVADANGK